MLPVNAAKTEQLVKSIEDTNSFIELEKERVHKGIEDMNVSRITLRTDVYRHAVI
mgnify:CR=1 FL=1